MIRPLFICGMVLIFIGTIIWANAQPIIDAITSTWAGQLSMMDESYRLRLQYAYEEVFYAQLMIMGGIILGVSSVFLGKKRTAGGGIFQK